MKRFFSILICAVLIVSLFPVIAAAEDTTAATMRLVEHEGSVTVKNASGKTLKITKDMRLYNNYQITTGSKSYAYISLDDSKAIKLDASSKVTISRQGRKLEILVEKGKLLFDVTKPLKKNETLNIRTATMITGVRGTIGWVEVNSSQQSGLYLLEGTTLVTTVDPQNGAGTTTSVHSGQVLTSSLSQEDGQDVLDVEVTALKEDETPGFVRMAISEDPEMQQRISENTDLDVDELTSNAEETLKQEEKAADEAEQEIREQLEQQVTEQTDPLFQESSDPAPQAPVITYTVLFEMNGHGEAVVGQLVQKGGLVVEPIVPTAEGYTFDGWFTEPECIYEWNFNRNTVTRNLTLYAKWITNRYAVSFDLNGHGNAISPQTVLYGGSVTEPAAPTADGLIFGGWFREKECVNRWDFASDTISADTTLYAKWSASSCTVSFELNGHGDAIPSQTIPYGDPVTEPANPTAEGFVFEGWFTDPNFLNRWDFASDTVTSDLTLYANWTVKTYHVTFNMNGYGSAVTAQTIAHGGTVTEPAEPTVEGMIFGGWFKETECINAWDFAADTITADTTLYAKWTVKTYTVSFDMGGHGETVTSQTITHGGIVTEPVLPTAEGFTFEGWFTDPDFTDQWDFVKNTVTSNIILYAKWTAVAVEPEPEPASYTVTFDLNGHGDPIDPQTVTEGGFATKPADPTAEGFTFGEWYIDAECTIPWIFDHDTVTENITLYAKWIAVSDTLELYDPTTEELIAALEEASASVYITTIEISNASLTVDTALTIPAGEVLIFIDGTLSLSVGMDILGTVSVCPGAELVNNGTINVLSKDSLLVLGRFVNNADLWIGGIGADGTMACGTMTVYADGKLENTGKIVIDTDTASIFYNSGTVINNGEFFVNTPGLFFSNGNYTENRADAVYAMVSNGWTVSYLGFLSDITAWPDGETLTLLNAPDGSIALPQTLLYLTGVRTTLDLNGHTVTLPVSEDGYAYSLTIEHDASLTVIDSSASDDYGMEGTGKLTSAADRTIDCMGTLILESGTIENTTSGYYSPAIYPHGSGSVTINGGNVLAKIHAISSMDISGNTSNTTIGGGYIYGGTAAIYNSGNGGCLYIYGGELVSDSIVIVSAGEYDAQRNSGTLIEGNAVLRLTAEYSEYTTTALISGNFSIQGGKLYARDPSFFEVLGDRRPAETGPDADDYYLVDFSTSQTSASSLAEFIAALNNNSVTHIYTYGDLTLSSDQPELADLTALVIPEGVTIEIFSGSITVAEGFTLEVYGEIVFVNGTSIISNGIYLDHTYELESNTEPYVTVTTRTEDGTETVIYCGPGYNVFWNYIPENENIVMFHRYDGFDAQYEFIPDAIPANTHVFFDIDSMYDTIDCIDLYNSTGYITLGENARLEFTNSAYVDEGLIYSTNHLFSFGGSIFISPGATLSAMNCSFNCTSKGAAAAFIVNGGSVGDSPNLELYGCSIGTPGAPVNAIELNSGYVSLSSIPANGDYGTGIIEMTIDGDAVVTGNTYFVANDTTFCYILNNSSTYSVNLINCTCYSTIINSGSELLLLNTNVFSSAGTGIENSGTADLRDSQIYGMTYALHNTGSVISQNSLFRLDSADGVYAVYSDTSGNPNAVVSLYGSFEAPTADQIFSEQIKQDTDEVQEQIRSDGQTTYCIYREYTPVTP